jgi:hypothetical protein
MGHFGYHPRDNDGAMDLIGFIEDAASNTARAMFAGDSGSGGGPLDHRYWEAKWARLGVVEFMVDARMSMQKRLVADALQDLAELLDGEASEVFFSSFKNPGAARRAAGVLRKKLSEMEPELPFGLPRALNKGRGPKLPRRPKKKNTATKRKPRSKKKPAPKTARHKPTKRFRP